MKLQQKKVRNKSGVIILIELFLLLFTMAFGSFIVTGQSIISLESLTALVTKNQSNPIIIDGINYIKEYDSLKREVVIKDNQNNNLLTARLLTEDIYFVIDRGEGIKQKVAEIEFTNLMRSNSFEDTFTKLYLYDINKGMGEFSRDIEYRLRIEKGSYEFPITETTCSNIEETNGTAQKCETFVIKNISERIYDYAPINSIEELPSGTFVLALFTDVKPGDNIEWIPTYFGDSNKIEEWATWTEGMNNGIKAFWKLNETSGTLVLDSVDRSTSDGLYNGTSSGVLVNSLGLIGKSYGFDDSTDSVNLSANMLNSTVQNFTFSFWVNVTADRAGGANWFYYYTQSSTTNPEIIFRHEDVDGLFQLWSGSTQCTFNPGDPELGKWEHYVFQFTEDGAGNCTLWKNGTVVGSDNSVSLTAYTANTNRFADNYQAGPAFNGTMDEVGWWDRYLTPSEIQDLYNSGTGISYDPINPCICPSLNTNWNISLADFCVINSACEIGSGNITFYNTGNFTCNANINASSFISPGNSNNIYVKPGCLMNIG